MASEVNHALLATEALDAARKPRKIHANAAARVKAWREHLLTNGYCIKCKKPSDSWQYLCKRCRKKRNAKQRKQRKARSAAGQCQVANCKQPPVTERRHCAKHLELRAFNQKLRRVRVPDGMCPRCCGVRPCEESKGACTRCLERQRTQNKRHRKKHPRPKAKSKESPTK